MTIAQSFARVAPNRRFADASIRTKLRCIASVSVAVALVMAFAGMAIHQSRFITRSKVGQLETQVRLLAFNSVGVLTFQDKIATRELLASMRMYPTVDYACVYDHNGVKLADYRRPGAVLPPEPDLKMRGSRFDDNSVDVCEPVLDGGERIGTVYVHANMSDFKDHFRSYLLICGMVMGCALLAASLIARMLQGSISGPVRALADAAKKVTKDRDFSVRVERETADELGQLGRTFNGMLDEIECSKSALQEAHDKLEQRVEERTEQLTVEVEQRRTAQDALEIACHQAEAASLAKSEFLANMSHEIRTPLNGILGFTELLQNSIDASEFEKCREYLETISSSGTHLLGLINDVLDLSKIEAGQLDVEQAPCSPHDLANQVVSVLRARAQQKGLNLELVWSSDVPESIVTDGGRLRQLLMNLVGNAIKFTRHGSVTIEARLDARTETLVFRVIDTGIGIAADKLKDIFNAFVQADNSVTRRYGGTGLGLAISKRLASALGGTLTVQSIEGHGSTFTLEVATGKLTGVEMLAAPEADAFRGTSVDVTPEEIELPPADILLVEDGEINRKLVRIMLEEAGAKVSTAENGWIAVNMTGKKKYDLILMDMQMPVMDGYKAATEMRASGIETPIIALTAHAMKGDEKKCLDAGCSGYLTKPIQGVKLLTTVLDQLPEEVKQRAANDRLGGPGEIDTEDATQVDADSSAAGQPGSNGDGVNGDDDAVRRIDASAAVKSTLPLENPVYQEIVNEFVDFLQDHVSDMQSAYTGGNLDELRQLAHALKGAGGTAGFDVLTAPASKLQHSAEGDDVTETEKCLAELADLASRIRQTPQEV